MARSGQTDVARKTLRKWIDQARPGDHVASVASLSAAAGGLSTSPTVGVLKEAITEGWIHSTRGQDGGYWRTDKQANVGLDEALDDLEQQFRATLRAIGTVRDALSARG